MNWWCRSASYIHIYMAAGYLQLHSISASWYCAVSLFSGIAFSFWCHFHRFQPNSLVQWYLQFRYFTCVFTWQLDCGSFIPFRAVGAVQLHCFLAVLFTLWRNFHRFQLQSPWTQIGKPSCCGRLFVSQVPKFHGAILEIANFNANLLQMFLWYSVHVSNFMGVLGATGPFYFATMRWRVSIQIQFYIFHTLCCQSHGGVKASLAYSWPFG